VQGLLAGYKYEHVGVFHAGTEPRNNLGDWAAYHVPSPEAATGYWVHAAKPGDGAARRSFFLSGPGTPSPLAEGAGAVKLAKSAALL